MRATRRQGQFCFRGPSARPGSVSTRRPIEGAGINKRLMGVSKMGSQADSSGVSGIEPNLGLLGRKIGMMRIFSDEGESIPVTVIDVSNNRMSQVKTTAPMATLRSSWFTASVGPLAWPRRRPATCEGWCPGRYLRRGIPRLPREGRGTHGRPVLGADLFVVGQYIDVQGVSQGKGFTGTIKRHNFRSNRASHGNSRSHNVPGSIGVAQDPGRVFPGKKMSGQMGNVTKTVQNLIVARVDTERGLLLVRGAVPGPRAAMSW